MRFSSLIAAALAASLVPAAARASVVPERFYLHGTGTEGQLVRGPDGAVWFADRPGIGRVDPEGRFHLYPVRGLDVDVLCSGPDDALWFADLRRSVLARMDLAGHVTLRARLPRAATVRGIASGPDGNLWVSESD